MPTMKNTIKRLRAQRDLTQADLADLLGVSRQTLNNIENNRYIPSLSVGMAIAQFFDRPVEEVFEIRFFKVK